MRLGESEYTAAIKKCQEKIIDGESYELCLTTQMMTTTTTVRPLDLYRELRRSNPSPFASFLQFGDSLSVVCCSPERFLKVDQERYVECKPIKGTLPRGRTPTEDEELRRQLANSKKEFSENIMIVDLMRSDIGRVCEVGSVHVPKLMCVESYATVHQLVSTIRGRLRDDVTALGCLRSCFPPGSMTGAPKLRSIQILEQLERGPRGIYSGCIGFAALNGTTDWNVVIRTAVFTPESSSSSSSSCSASSFQVPSSTQQCKSTAASPRSSSSSSCSSVSIGNCASGRRHCCQIGAGGAIVHMSDVQLEWHEMLLKTKALISGIEAVHCRHDSLNKLDKLFSTSCSSDTPGLRLDADVDKKIISA